MRLSELLHSEVYDADGKKLGHVFEVEADKSGPVIGDIEGHALRVVRLMVGPGSAVLRLGYQRRHIRGPLGLKFLADRLKGYAIPWSDIAEIEDRTIRLRRGSGELSSLGDG